MPILLETQDLRLDSSIQRTIISDEIPLGKWTDAIQVIILRPTKENPIDWPEDCKLQVSIVLIVDGEEHRCIGTVSGGIRQNTSGEDIPEYRLTYCPTYGFFGDPGSGIKRIGEKAKRSYSARIEIVPLKGKLVSSVFSLVSESIPKQIPFHSSVAFDAASSAKEEGGDATLTVPHTIGAGSDIGLFVGAINGDGSGGNLCTGATWNGSALTEAWDYTFGPFGGNAGYHWPGGSSCPTGLNNAVITCAGASPERFAAGVISMTGVDQTTPVGTAVTNSGTTTPATVTVTGLTTDGMICDNLATGFPTDTEGANQTLQNTQVPSFGGASITMKQSTQSSNDGGVMSWTLAGGDPNGIGWGIGAIEFKPAGGVAAIPKTQAIIL